MRYAARLATLGPSAGARLRIFAATLYLVARNRLRLPPARSIVLRLATPGGSFSAVVDQISDMHAVDEILLRRQYDHELGAPPQTIVDLGSHIGISVGYFRRRYPDARIFAFEPNPRSFAKLQRVIAGMDGVVARNVALSDRSGEAMLHAADRPLRASLTAPCESGRAVTVQTTTLERAVRELSIDRIGLLKIDVEGAELDVLSAFEQIDRVETIVGELHPTLLGARAGDLLELLSGHDVRTWPAGDDIMFLARRR